MKPDRFRLQVASAKSHDRLVALKKLLYAQWTNGELLEEVVEELDAQVAARWEEISERRTIPPEYRPRSIFPIRKLQKAPDPDASARRRRVNSLRGAQPYSIAVRHSEGKRAVAYEIAKQHLVNGQCTLSNDEIAARAGVCRSTVRNYRVDAVSMGEIAVIERPNRGAPNDTNIIRIVCKDWIAWLKKRRKTERGIGCKGFTPLSPTKEEEISNSRFPGVDNTGDKDPAPPDAPLCREAISGAPS